jgi:hypothetical protein
MLPFPEEPEVPPLQRAAGPIRLRYEDVTQDGRLALAGLPHALGEVIWQNLFVDDALAAAWRESGVVPLLTRVAVEGADETVSVRKPLHGEGRYELAHAVGHDGAVARILLNMWVRVSGPRGRTWGPPPDGAGEPVQLGRIFAEHVFTRPFGPPARRKVLRLELPGIAPVPPARAPFVAAEELLVLPPGAQPLEPAAAPDTTAIVFGLDHSDSNQHVNSLVYPRLFTEAALRRLDALGRPTAGLLARAAETAWRKPCFAGDRVRIILQTFALGDALGAAGAFLPDALAAPGAPPPRPYCCVRVLFPAPHARATRSA